MFPSTALVCITTPRIISRILRSALDILNKKTILLHSTKYLSEWMQMETVMGCQDRGLCLKTVLRPKTEFCGYGLVLGLLSLDA